MKSLKILELVGASLTIVGSFLPWERAGGFLGYITNGIRVDLANFKYWVSGIHTFPVYDYGGVLVILLTLVIVFLAIQPPRIIPNPTSWNLIISVGLMALSLFFLGRWLIHWFEFGNLLEKPTLMIGLVCVVFGAALLLWRAVMSYHWVTSRHPQKAG